MNKKTLIFNLTFAALFVALITICSWISIRVFVVPFTLQTLAIFLCIYILDWKVSTLSILIYILLGIAGVPIFSNFTGGFAVILGPTGGYIIGFIFMPLIYHLFSLINKNKLIFKIIGMIISLLICYLFGSLWFYFVYSNSGNNITFVYILSICVLPFLLPDAIKMAIAFLIGYRLKKLTPFK